MPSRVSEPTLSFKRLHSTFGVEVEGIDWSKPLSESVIKEIEDAADREGVLVFRNANLNNEQHISFTSQLGKPMDVKAHIKAGRVMRFPDQPEIFDVSNLDDKNQIVTDADPARKEGNKGNFIWHADMTYNPHRAKYSILRAVELPPKGSGGETEYLDSRTAYEELPSDLQSEVDRLITHNSLFHNRKLGAPEYFKNIEPLDMNMAKYKVAVPHEGSGRTNLYFTSYAHHFDGMSREESKPLMDKIWEHLTQDKYKLAVFWENNGDMVLWDNTAVLHRATNTGSYDGKHRRDMRRTTTFDDGKYGWGENDPNDPWQAGLGAGYTKK